MKKITYLLIILSLFIAGCSNNTISENVTKQTTNKNIEVDNLNYQDIVLNLNDLPKDWFLINRIERTKSEISKFAIENGWKTGYNVKFGWLNENFQNTYLDIYFSEYPKENLNIILNDNKVKNATIEELSNPKIGENSRAFKIISKNEFNEEEIEYEIVFYKKNLLVSIYLGGNTLDYEFLKEIAKKQEVKIK